MSHGRNQGHPHRRRLTYRGGMRPGRIVTALLLIVAAAAAAIVANLALLNYGAAGSDPVGRLSPRAHLPAAPAVVVRPREGPVERDGNDD